jgi:hypothetical protein
MNHLFRNRFANQPTTPETGDASFMEMLTANAGRDMPLEASEQADAIVLESREQMLHRLSTQNNDAPTAVQNGTMAYREMMTRIESNDLSPMFAQEMDDFMNADVPVAVANNT